MSKSSSRKSLLVLLSALSFILFVTLIISVFARGYRIDFNKGFNLNATGLLSATSRPKSASVYINDRLITATDDTINLPPDEYTIKIVKDGYLPWQKKVSIKKEVVFQTDAQLFRSVPDLRPLTLSGAINPAASPDGTKIVYAVASASAARDNGLYQIELTDNPIPISRNTPRQITPNLQGIDWSKFTYKFSPNSRELLATSITGNVSYLIPMDTAFNARNLYDVTPRLPLIQEEWGQQLSQIMQTRLERLPEALQGLVSTVSASHLAFNSADDKVFYLAKTDGQITNHIITPPPAQSTQPQTRTIKTGNYYVYDIKDDTNFLIGSQKDLQNPSWLPNSNDIVFVQDGQIRVIEYDATNKQTLFGGKFAPDVVFPWTDGTRIVTLTTPYDGAPENLYSITIR